MLIKTGYFCGELDICDEVSGYVIFLNTLQRMLNFKELWDGS